MRDDRPSGTVTFLFTDVEDSTKLLDELGAEDYAEALGEHRQLIREACADGGGVEVDTQGDALFLAFPTAPGALKAAAAFTEALAPGPVHVRVGVHTGTPLRTDEGYVGGDVHRAARIAACGHGGQVLVSASTAQLVEFELTRPWRSPAQGPVRSRTPVPARRARIPGAQVALPHEPADPGHAVPRKGAGAFRGGRAPVERRCSPPHADRARRDREDAARPAGGGHGFGGLSRRRSSGCRLRRFGTQASSSRQLARYSARRALSPSTSPTGGCSVCSTISKQVVEAASDLAALVSCLPEPRRPRHEQGAPARLR